MNVPARSLLLLRWPVTCLAWLTLAPGCSGGSQKEPALSPVLDERGVITFRYVTPEPPSPSPSPKATSDLGVLLREQQQLDAEIRQRRQDEAALQNTMRRELQEQRRREQQEEDANQEAWRKNRQIQRSQEREQEQVYQEQRRRWSAQQMEPYQAESMRLQQDSQRLDALLQRQSQQQAKMMPQK